MLTNLILTFLINYIIYQNSNIEFMYTMIIMLYYTVTNLYYGIVNYDYKSIIILLILNCDLYWDVNYGKIIIFIYEFLHIIDIIIVIIIGIILFIINIDKYINIVSIFNF